MVFILKIFRPLPNTVDVSNRSVKLTFLISFLSRKVFMCHGSGGKIMPVYMEISTDICKYLRTFV